MKLDLGEELARGGEGAVYHVRGNGDVLAKLYHDALDVGKVAKLKAMPALVTPELLAISAWPGQLLQVGPNREVRGFLMPRARDHRAIHVLYGPAQRRKEFPRADWRFLVQAAQNVAAAFATFHQHGHVIGDVNQGNILVSPDARVKLIDCDSMQIREGGKVHLCEVGVAHFTPPELQGRSFAGVVRDANHDAFGLAVVIFHLLFMGRHPYAGIYGGPEEMPLEKAIVEGRFAYGSNAGHARMRPPPHTPSFSSLTPRVRELFEQAFATGSRQRPPASEWYTALQQMGAALQPCPRNPAHRYVPNAGSCPWCAIEQGGGPDFFVSLTVAAITGSGFDLAKLWRELQALPPVPAEPGLHLLKPAPARNAAPVRPSMAWASRVGTPAIAVGVVSLILALVAGSAGIGTLSAGVVLVGLLLVFGSGSRAEKKARQARLAASDRQHQAALARYTREVRPPVDDLKRMRRDFEKRREAYLDLPAQYRAARTALNQQVRQNQLRRFLDGAYIENANIPGVGPVKVDALASFGIETAADVSYHAVIKVPGFGPKLTNKVVAWRSAIEARFVFDPAAGVNPADVAALDRKFAQAQREAEKELTEVALRVHRASATAMRAHAEVSPVLEAAASALAQAQADVRAL
ncbi:hypothetical protein [Longimicrobium sp.]|uniref:helix-hairpin-helix domain-containing protein n=1 Tax=Longimicrobium sp. TaxID=2029185 RepID=UPI002E3527B9|nr:hypothetical protein [Longimicrobium sp.]HEX6041722.1 hypothetical protein [Longimicrobium sp.]